MDKFQILYLKYVNKADVEGMNENISQEDMTELTDLLDMSTAQRNMID